MSHHCHALGCETSCKPELLMCPKHWRKVPPKLQAAVWASYRVGQCDDKNPSREWLDAANAAICAVADLEGKRYVVAFGGHPRLVIPKPRVKPVQGELPW